MSEKGKKGKGSWSPGACLSGTVLFTGVVGIIIMGMVSYLVSIATWNGLQGGCDDGKACTIDIVQSHKGFPDYCLGNAYYQAGTPCTDNCIVAGTGVCSGREACEGTCAGECVFDLATTATGCPVLGLSIGTTFDTDVTYFEKFCYLGQCYYFLTYTDGILFDGDLCHYVDESTVYAPALDNVCANLISSESPFYGCTQASGLCLGVGGSPLAACQYTFACSTMQTTLGPASLVESSDPDSYDEIPEEYETEEEESRKRGNAPKTTKTKTNSNGGKKDSKKPKKQSKEINQLDIKGVPGVWTTFKNDIRRIRDRLGYPSVNGTR